MDPQILLLHTWAAAHLGCCQNGQFHRRAPTPPPPPHAHTNETRCPPIPMQNPKILLLNIELELKAEKENAEVRLEDPAQYQAIVDAGGYRRRVLSEGTAGGTGVGTTRVLPEGAAEGTARGWGARVRWGVGAGHNIQGAHICGTPSSQGTLSPQGARMERFCAWCPLN